MGLVGKVGHRRPRARLAMLLVYAVLCLGAITTLYPFVLMASTGFKGPTDQNDNKLIPQFWSNTEGRDAAKLQPESLYAKYLADKYSNNQSQIDSARIGADASVDDVQAYARFLEALPLDYWAAGFRTAPSQQTGRLTMLYQQWLRKRYRTIDDLNRSYIEENAAFQTVAPPTELLDRQVWLHPRGNKYAEWLVFKATLPAEFRVPVREQRMFQEFLRSKFQNQISRVPPELAAGAKDFEHIPLASSGAVLQEFKAKALPPRYAKDTAESLWAKAGHTGPLPIDAYEHQTMSLNASSLRSEFSTRNYRYVLDYILLNGRSLWNTVIFCFLAILTQLIVNPLAAYALSRYPIKASSKILLFLLATMAFPAEVAMIPSFLLLKQLGLLNTFAALVLPAAASGYMIFLLKGFFDSLPQELYESGQIDGAKETTLMFRITFPLSRPVLGYIALLAFMGAYGSFLYAFLVAQDQRMWTLMVWIYELQTTAPKAVIMAALTVAAIPTLLVFLAAQRVIMRGIILPGER